MGDDTLSTLNWLVEAGAGDAMGETPVNRLVAPAVLPAAMPRPTAPSRPVMAPQAAPVPLDGGDISGALALAASAQDLAQLKAALESYEGCALKRTATNTVFADGTPDGGILFIGEVPDRDEDRIGKPFVGRAGQLLDKMLLSIGLDRNVNAYITNVINWRPPDNRDPSPEDVAHCLPFLRRHIELANPELIVLLGAVAARHVVGQSEGIMKIRGRWLEYRVGTRMVPLMATLPPAYLLNLPAHKKLAWLDLQAIQARMATIGLPRIPLRANS
jgi:uracil-DNA glycosylase family 4